MNTHVRTHTHTHTHTHTQTHTHTHTCNHTHEHSDYTKFNLHSLKLASFPVHPFENYSPVAPLHQQLAVPANILNEILNTSPTTEVFDLKRNSQAAQRHWWFWGHWWRSISTPCAPFPIAPMCPHWPWPVCCPHAARALSKGGFVAPSDLRSFQDAVHKENHKKSGKLHFYKYWKRQCMCTSSNRRLIKWTTQTEEEFVPNMSSSSVMLCLT